jgi:hypothetical protein
MHKEFRDAVFLGGKAARVRVLESQMLASDNSAVINARRFALVNAAPEEWGETSCRSGRGGRERPVRLLAKQIAGTLFARDRKRPRSSSTSLLHRAASSRRSA